MTDFGLDSTDLGGVRNGIPMHKGAHFDYLLMSSAHVNCYNSTLVLHKLFDTLKLGVIYDPVAQHYICRVMTTQPGDLSTELDFDASVDGAGLPLPPLNVAQCDGLVLSVPPDQGPYRRLLVAHFHCVLKRCGTPNPNQFVTFLQLSMGASVPANFDSRAFFDRQNDEERSQFDDIPE